MNNVDGGKIIVGGIGSFFVLWILQQYNTKIAYMYLGLILLLVSVLYWPQLYASIMLVQGTIINKVD